jgi:hypothetical protein
MKTKLTLTVSKKAIEHARRYSRKTGKSISRMFEEIFETPGEKRIKSSRQISAERLLEVLESSRSVKTRNDKKLLREHVARKFA